MLFTSKGIHSPDHGQLRYGAVREVNNPLRRAFVGRAAELRLIASLSRNASGGKTQVLLIAGEQGIGKTRLLNEAEARDPQAHFIFGHGLELSPRGIPFGPWLSALSQLPQGSASADHEPVDLADLFDLTADVEVGQPSAAHRSDAQATRLYARCRAYLEQAAAARKPLVVVIEDLQWASASTLELFGFLAATFRNEPIVLIGTLGRDLGHDVSPPKVGALVRGVRRLPNYVELRLPPMSERDCDRLARTLATDLSPGLLARVIRLSGGNPLFVDQLIAFSEGGDEHVALPGSLTTLIAARLDSLSTPARRTVQILAAAARPLPETLLAVATGLAPRRLSSVLLELLGNGHVERLDADVYRIRHSLVAESAYASLTAHERQRLHRALAGAIDSAEAQLKPASTGLAERAYHLRMAGRLAEALTAFFQAARAARSARAFAEAESHYESGLALWNELRDNEALAREDRGLILQEAAEVAFAAGDATRACSLVREALESIHGIPPSFEGSLRRRLGSFLLGLTRDGEAIAELRTSAALLRPEAPSIEYARAVGTLGAALMLTGNYSASRDSSREALRIAHVVGDTFLTSQAMNFLGVAECNLGRIRAGLALLTRAVEVGRQCGRPEAELEGLLNRAEMLCVADRLDEAIDVAWDGVHLADELGLSRGMGALLMASAAGAMFHAGRWSDAEEILRNALETVALEEAHVSLLAIQGSIRVARGDLSEAREALSLAKGMLDPGRVEVLPMVATAEAEVARLDGDLESARAVLRNGLALLERTDAARARLSHLAAAARIEADDAESSAVSRLPARRIRAMKAADELQVIADSLPSRLTRPSGIRAERCTVLAEVRRAKGEPSVDAWEEVVGLWQSAGRPYPRAYSLYRLAQAHLQAHDRTRARTALLEAAAIATDLGAEPLGDAIGALAKRARIPLGKPSSRPVRRSRPGGLTAREMDVLQLVAKGVTNRHIAETLFVSQATVATHVSHILAKLEVATRQEAAAYADVGERR